MKRKDVSKMSVVGIIVAFIAGGVFGVIIMALLQANGRFEDNIVEGGDKDVEQGNCNRSHNEGPRA